LTRSPHPITAIHVPFNLKSPRRAEKGIWMVLEVWVFNQGR